MAPYKHFVEGDKVTVRFCTMDETSFRFWKEFDEVSSMSGSPVFQTSFNLSSNMEGALGYWAGYGATYCPVIVGQDWRR